GVSGKTGSDGVALLVNVAAGQARVSANDPVRHVGGNTTVTVPADGTVEAAITLQRVESISGRVLAPNGHDPVPGAVVAPLYRGGAIADDEGRFELANLIPGTYELGVTVEGRYRAVVPNVTAPSTIDLVIGGLGTVRGTVLAPAGTPAAGASVSLTLT